MLQQKRIKISKTFCNFATRSVKHGANKRNFQHLYQIPPLHTHDIGFLIFMQPKL